MENKTKVISTEELDPHDPKNPLLQIKMRHRTYWIVGAISLVLTGTIVTAVLGAVFLQNRVSARAPSQFAYGWNQSPSGSYDTNRQFRKDTSIYTFSPNDSGLLTSIAVEKEDAYLVFPKSNDQKTVLRVHSSFTGDASGIEGIYLPTLYTEVAASSFSGLSSLKEIHFSSETNANQSNQQSLQDYALSDNPALSSVTFASSLSTLGAYAFTNDISLTVLDFSKTSLRSLGEGAFSHCTSLESVSFPSSLISLPKGLFQNDAKLTTIYFSGSKETWSALTKAEGWNEGTSLTQIVCQNGTLTL